jgi:pimeloyl-ACP methyl ester carboxylesterase
MRSVTPPIRAEFLQLRTNGVTLHAAAAGPVEGPLVILLHGFPEFQ